MTRLASALSLALVFTLAACDDDDPAAPTDAGAVAADGGAGDAGAAGDGGGATICTGTFAGVPLSQLQLATAASMKMCAAASDVQLICTQNIAMVAGTCGVGCVGMGEACINTCIRNMIPLSQGCASCYVGTVACTQAMCLTECINNPAAEVCTNCQIQKGCRAAFFACSGLPGGAPAGDGGAGDGGVAGDGGAATDGAAGDAMMSVDAAGSDVSMSTADAAGSVDSATD
jgi:hypothetical protein